MVEKVPVASREGLANGTGNMQSVYDRATCCQSTFFSPLSPHPSRYGDARPSLEGSTVGSPLVILMYKSSNPNSRHTRSQNFREDILLSLPLSLSFFPSTVLDTEKASPGIPRAFRINKGSEARRKAFKHEKARTAGCFGKTRSRRKMLRKSGRLARLTLTTLTIRTVEYIFQYIYMYKTQCGKLREIFLFFFSRKIRGG